MLTVAEALAILEAELPGPRAEELPAAEAAGRVLAAQVRAGSDWPPFDTSAMDGYAVRRADVPGTEAELTERPGRVAAGDGPGPPLAPRESVRVMTGAPLPEGTEAIVPVEQTVRQDGRVRFEAVPVAGTHIRRRGESIAAGTVLLPAGRRLTPADVALAALCGADPLAVNARPRVTVASTGNELVERPEARGARRLRDSNGPMLVSLCRARGWPVQRREPVPDDPPEIERLFSEAGAEEDFLVTTGGVSAGDLDLLPEIAQRCGFRILFHRVSVRPGKPIAVARRAETFWFGLPGNPVSASVGFHLFVRHAGDRFEGDARPGVPRVCARLMHPVRAAGPRETYRDALLSNAAGELLAEPLASRGSHDLAAHARADALIRLPAGAAELPAGAVVECVLLQR